MAPPQPKRPPLRSKAHDVTARETLVLEAAWQELPRVTSLADLAQPWLALQIQQAGANAGAVFQCDAEGGGLPEALSAEPEPPSQVLINVAERAIRSGQPVTDRATDRAATAFVAQPLVVGGQTRGAVVLVIDDVSPQRLRLANRMLIWGLAWLRERLAADLNTAARRQLDAMRAAHKVVAAAHDDHRFRAASLGTVTRLAHLAKADRVTFGLSRDGRTRVKAVSHSAEFGKRLTLARDLAAAMDEAIDQRAALNHPAPEDEINVTRQQAALSDTHGPSAILTVPFQVADAYSGAFTFERDPGDPFTSEDVALLDFVASLAGPTLWEKHRNDKALVFKAADTLRSQCVALLGPGYAARKIAVVCLVALTALFATWSQPYRVTADARVEGAIERSLVAPFDGFVRDAPIRAGDLVTKGAVIAALDDRELALERLRWMTEARQKGLELGRAIGEQNRAEAEIIRTQVAQAEAQIELIDTQLDRAKILAPFDGIVVSGDLSQNIGGAVSRGDALFEIAPSGDYRVVLLVDESRVGEVSVGQTGDLVLGALPKTSFAFEIKKLTPVAIARDGRNTFRVEARLTKDAGALGPGMEGVAKIDIDDRLVIEIWTRAFVDWLRLTAWTWFG